MVSGGCRSVGQNVFGTLKIKSKLILATLGITFIPTIVVLVLYMHRLKAHHLEDEKLHILYLIGALLAILAGLVIAYIVARRLTAPLDQLTEAARQVAWGSLSVNLDDLAQRPDEYGELATAFQDMSAGLKKKIELLQISQEQMQIHNDQLKDEIKEHQKTLEQKDTLHNQLIATSREAGMAEIASAVLHNVGNVLNSINISTTMINERMNRSQFQNFLRVAELIQDHRQDLSHYIQDDVQGKHLPDAILQLAESLDSDFHALTDEIGQMTRDVDNIKKIISAQQSYVTHVDVEHSTNAVDVLNDALAINKAGIEQRDIQVVFDPPELPAVFMDKHKVLQVLVNLISNAKSALDTIQSQRLIHADVKLITGDVRAQLQYQITDNGCGIAQENLKRIFSHGYTTRVDGRGYGLHYSILTATELGGSLIAESDGPGKGATFTLTLPVKMDQPAAATA